LIRKIAKDPLMIVIRFAVHRENESVLSHDTPCECNARGWIFLYETNSGKEYLLVHFLCNVPSLNERKKFDNELYLYV
jgi:hypothetical protein